MALADARQAYFDGEFERCLVLCDAVRATSDATRFEIAMLRACVHVRLDRGDRTLDALRRIEFTALTLDEYVAAHMLTGAAYVRLGQKERGEAVLSDAMDKAGAAHPTVRAEVAVELGIAKFRLGAFEEADRLCASVPSDSDIIYARALEYRGWVAHARNETAVAAQRFREALAALNACRRRDRYVEAKSLYGLTALCSELLRCDDWPAVESRLLKFDWSASGVARWRFWVSIAASMMCETTGDVAGARRWVRDAEALAESPPFRVVALCRLAAVFRGIREVQAHAEFVARASEVYDTLDVRDLSVDMLQIPLYLAEEVAHTGAREATERLLAQYRESILPGLKSSSSDLERYDALERTVEATLLDARGEASRALPAYVEAHRIFTEIGYRRRATGIALRLARLTGKKQYFTYAEEALAGASPQFWMSRDLCEMRRGNGPSVTETQMTILRLLVLGKTYKEIAAVRCTSAKTVGNHVQALFRTFAVNSRGELTATALPLGVVSLEHNGRST